MGYVWIERDAGDLETHQLLSELRHRQVEVPFEMDVEVMEELRTAYYSRNASRFEMILSKIERAAQEPPA
jgi:hypothetical protein